MRFPEKKESLSATNLAHGRVLKIVFMVNPFPQSHANSLPTVRIGCKEALRWISALWCLERSWFYPLAEKEGRDGVQLLLGEGQKELNPTLASRTQFTFYFLTGVFLTLWVSLKSKTISLVLNFHFL